MAGSSLNQLYQEREAYRLPLYSARQVARLTGLAATTVTTWTRAADALVQPAGAEALSFLNLVEVHVLAAIRHQHGLPLQRVRHAVQFVRQELGADHPLAQHEFETDGVDLFVRALEDENLLINASRRGQMTIRQLVEAYLRRIERAPDGFPLRLFPVYGSGPGFAPDGLPTLIAVDPTIAFGRPVLTENYVPVDVVANMYRAGDPVPDIAAEYGLSVQSVEEAIRYERATLA
ncbi:DUF433 domain-containing protein [Hymenobacter metallilatus]|uniref:DUF433 domain-containing protein n=1 Tax=Hymenobacter metallilatus TaxID=2493666 RepID=A0A428JQY8_9BACT|nr:DUF433 domain-containing protein [Hymenobacter metallilatus]RSK35986.1 DUF433 domain-containing protein [Hymenobacter metallilatus]